MDRWITGDGRPDRKVGAIGIRVSRGVTMHGFALNCDCDLGWFDKIVPCGIKDAGVTSLAAEAGRPVTVAELIPLAEHHLGDVFAASAWRRADLASLLPRPELGVLQHRAHDRVLVVHCGPGRQDEVHGEAGHAAGPVDDARLLGPYA